MGIGFFTAEYMARAIEDFDIRGSVLTLGRQDIWFDEQQLAQLTSKMDWATVDDKGIAFHDKKRASRFRELHDKGLAHRRGDRQYVSDELLFSALGFQSLDSADANDFEGATVIHDFNHLGLAETAGKQFDFIFDGGTAEHVFHFPNMLRNIFDALKVGGFIMHTAPSNNHVDHGFYQFSPTVFYDWYAANGWSIKRADFFKYAASKDVPWEFTSYSPGSLEHISYGGLDSALYGIAFCAQRTSGSTWDRIPQQNFYIRNWPSRAAKESEANDCVETMATPVSLRTRIARAMKRLGGS